MVAFLCSFKLLRKVNEFNYSSWWDVGLARKGVAGFFIQFFKCYCISKKIGNSSSLALEVVGPRPAVAVKIEDLYMLPPIILFLSRFTCHFRMPKERTKMAFRNKHNLLVWQRCFEVVFKKRRYK